METRHGRNSFFDGGLISFIGWHILGTILAAKLHGKNGWLVGLAVGVFFYIALYIIGVLLGASSKFGFYEIVRFVLCIVVGFLSGMLGINIGES